jgi:pilus assembly protein CpaF
MWSDPVTLVIRHPDGEESRYDLDPGIYPIGSDSSNRIELAGTDISWRHAILAFTPDGVWAEDLNSPAGTFVNDVRVKGRVPLKPRDVVRIGRYQLIVQPEHPTAAAAAPAPAAAAVNPPPLPNPAPTAQTAPGPAAPAPAHATSMSGSRRSERLGDKERDVVRAVKKQIQEELLKRLELKRLTASRIGEQDLRERVMKNVQDIVREVRGRLPASLDPVRLTKDIYDEAVGLGPLEDLLARDDITEIERIVAPIGRRIDESSPMVDARLPDGSRVNAIIPPPRWIRPMPDSIRKFPRIPLARRPDQASRAP